MGRRCYPLSLGGGGLGSLILDLQILDLQRMASLTFYDVNYIYVYNPRFKEIEIIKIVFVIICLNIAFHWYFFKKIYTVEM